MLANIIHVPTDQTTIQAGINAATIGDTVLVAVFAGEDRRARGAADRVGAITPGEQRSLVADPVDVGELTWMVLGSTGSINDTGLFIATEPGVCSVMVTSSINGVYDISDSIIIEALLISEINPGNCTVYPGAENMLLKAFRIGNYYFEDKTIIGVSVRDASNGQGNQEERLSNLQALYLFYDKNQNSILDAADSLISSTTTISLITSFTFSPVYGFGLVL